MNSRTNVSMYSDQFYHFLLCEIWESCTSSAYTPSGCHKSNIIQIKKKVTKAEKLTNIQKIQTELGLNIAGNDKAEYKEQTVQFLEYFICENVCSRTSGLYSMSEIYSPQ